MRTRRGASLVELLTVMSACTIILSMCGALIHRSMRSHADARAFFNVEGAALRLSKQFRQDVHQAQGVSDTGSASDDRLVQLQLPDGRTVDYRSGAQTVMRILSDGGQPVSQEEFAFGTDVQAVLKQAGTPERLMLSITAVPLADTATEGEQRKSLARQLPVKMQVEAIVGKSGRLQPTTTRTEKSR